MEEESKMLSTAEGKRKWYFKELRKVIDVSDIILEVLDARDPLGCRAPDIERLIAQQTNATDGMPSKKIVLVLNKVDLVPAEVVAAWVKYLRREFPTLAFKSSTQQQRSRIGQIGGGKKMSLAASTQEKALQSSSAVGSGSLMQLLKNYCRSSDVKRSINVGVIGYPNVGKSSIINSLKRARAVQVSSAPGCTKSLQHVRLDKNINLIDSPGVLFDADDDEVTGVVAEHKSDEGLDEHQKQARGSGSKHLLLRNVLKVEQVEDPVEAVQGKRCKCIRMHASACMLAGPVYVCAIVCVCMCCVCVVYVCVAC